MRSARLGAGLTSVPPMPLVDASTAVMADPVVPEGALVVFKSNEQNQVTAGGQTIYKVTLSNGSKRGPHNIREKNLLTGDSFLCPMIHIFITTKLNDFLVFFHF